MTLKCIKKSRKRMIENFFRLCGNIYSDAACNAYRNHIRNAVFNFINRRGAICCVELGYIHVWLLHKSKQNSVHSRLMLYDTTCQGNILHIIVLPILVDNYSYLIIDVNQKIEASSAPESLMNLQLQSTQNLPSTFKTEHNLDTLDKPLVQLNAILIDAGHYSSIMSHIKFLEKTTYVGCQININAILSTHHHWDHQGGNYYFYKNHNVPIYGSPTDKIDCLTNPVYDNDTLYFSNNTICIKVIKTPCHTKGSVVYKLLSTLPISENAENFDPNKFPNNKLLDANSNLVPDSLFTGDTLFLGGSGSVFEGTRHQMLVNFWKIIKDCSTGGTLLYPGHEYTAEILQSLVSSTSSESCSCFFSLCHALRRAKSFRKMSPSIPTVPYILSEEFQYNPCFKPIRKIANYLTKCLDFYLDLVVFRRDYLNSLVTNNDNNYNFASQLDFKCFYSKKYISERHVVRNCQLSMELFELCNKPQQKTDSEKQCKHQKQNFTPFTKYVDFKGSTPIYQTVWTQDIQKLTELLDLAVTDNRHLPAAKALVERFNAQDYLCYFNSKLQLPKDKSAKKPKSLIESHEIPADNNLQKLNVASSNFDFESSPKNVFPSSTFQSSAFRFMISKPLHLEERRCNISMSPQRSSESPTSQSKPLNLIHVYKHKFDAKDKVLKSSFQIIARQEDKKYIIQQEDVIFILNRLSKLEFPAQAIQNFWTILVTLSEQRNAQKNQLELCSDSMPLDEFVVSLLEFFTLMWSR